MNKEFNEDNVVKAIMSKACTGCKGGGEFIGINTYELDDIADEIMKLQCPKCKNIRYMEWDEVKSLVDRAIEEPTQIDIVVDEITNCAIPDAKKTPGKCNCITCKHVTEMHKLLPDEDLCNKVMAVTDDLYDAMANESLDAGMKIMHQDKKIRELKKAIEGLIKATEILREGMLDNLD